MRAAVPGVVCLSTLLVQAQGAWVIYSAHYSTTTLAAGSPPNVVEGERYRDSAGDICGMNPAKAEHTLANRTLYDATHSIFYEIDTTNRKAVGVSRPLSHFQTPTYGAIGHEVVGNLATTIYPIRNGRDHTPTVGRVWVVDGTDIILKIHSEIPNGSYDFRLTNVELYREPDQALFSIPLGFDLSKPSSD